MNRLVAEPVTKFPSEHRRYYNPRHKAGLQHHCKIYRLITIELYGGLYPKKQCLTFIGIHQVNSGQPFEVLIDNFTKTPVELIARQVGATAEEHLYMIME